MRKLSMLLVLAVVAISCQKDNLSDEPTQSMRKSSSACDVVSPQSVADAGAISRPGGNADCNGADYDYSSDRVNRNSDNTWDASFPDGFSVIYDESSKQLTWSYTSQMVDGVLMCLDGIQVIAKGGSGAQVYSYGSDVHCGEEVSAPGTADISNLTLCYNLKTCSQTTSDTCYEGESAWGEGTRYVNRGNWATYSTYPTGGGSVTLYAGQTHDAGTITFSAVSNGEVTIDITLNSGFVFDGDVHIQGYNSTPPSINPAPGHFDHKFAQLTGMVVDEAMYYGIHVNVNREVPCED